MNMSKKFYHACETGDLEKVEQLLAPRKFFQFKKNSVNDLHFRVETPLYIAARNGCQGLVELLIAHGANVNTGVKNWAPLYIAAQNGHKEIVELLIANGADVNEAKNGGWTPLHVAAEKGRKEIVELLLANGANMAAVEEYYDSTPLGIAVKYDQPEVAQLLRARGAESLGSKKVDNDQLAREYLQLWEAAIMEKTAGLVNSGQPVRNEEIAKYAVNRASQMMIDKYGFSIQRMVEIATHAAKNRGSV
jgi:ankyrin repeat protein